MLQNEIQERHSLRKEITTLKNLFQQTTISFQNMELQDCPEKAEQLEVRRNDSEWADTGLKSWIQLLELKVIRWLVSREPRKGKHVQRPYGVVWQTHRRSTWLEHREQIGTRVGNRPVWNHNPFSTTFQVCVMNRACD